MSAKCPSCSAELQQGTRFCGKCGKSVEAAGGPAAAPLHKKTMMAFEGVQLPGAPAAAPQPSSAPSTPAAQPAAAQPSGGGGKPPLKTMMGLPPGVQLPGAPAAQPAEAPPTRESSAEPAFAKTMVGAAAGAMAASPPAEAKAKPASGGGVPKSTMIGAAGLPMNLPGAAAPAAGSAPAVAAADSGASAALAGGRTMLGVSGPGGNLPAAAAAAQAPAVGGGRTMLGAPGLGMSGAAAGGLGQQATDPEQPAFPAPAQAREPFTDPPRGDQDDEAPAGVRRQRGGRSGMAVAIGAGALVALLGVGALMLSSGKKEPAVQASVVTIDTGEAMLFEVPGAPQGSKIRFGGQEKPLTSGRATFPLAADSLRVGDNAVLVDVLYPDGGTENARITLAVEYRVRVDISALQAGKPSLDVVVTALPGTQVQLDGESLKLDAEGRGVRTYPVDVVEGSKTGHVEHVVRYRLQPPSGEVTVDELRTKIPLTMMQIDRPGFSLVTDAEILEVAGAVSNETVVKIDDAEVPVRSGRFLHKLPLKAPGEYKPRVVAHAKGRAPVGVTLHVTRVADLRAAAAGFEADKSLTYARIVQNPSIYKGQKVALEGRVYNVNVEGGRSVLQMLVRDCPAGNRCSLWVTYGAATDFMVDSWVRVLGTVEGQQQFRSESNEVVSVPKVDAVYLLPTKP